MRACEFGGHRDGQRPRITPQALRHVNDVLYGGAKREVSFVGVGSRPVDLDTRSALRSRAD